MNSNKDFAIKNYVDMLDYAQNPSLFSNNFEMGRQGPELLKPSLFGRRATKMQTQNTDMMNKGLASEK